MRFCGGETGKARHRRKLANKDAQFPSAVKVYCDTFVGVATIIETSKFSDSDFLYGFFECCLAYQLLPLTC